MDSRTVKTESRESMTENRGREEKNRESRKERGEAARIKSWDAFKWLAVPFFFMLTGYFTVQVRKTEKKMFLLYLGVTCLYLPACMLGLVLMTLLLKCGKENAVAVSILLYVIGLLGDSYFGLVRVSPLLSKVYDGMFTCFSYTRNGIFMAPLFLLLGRLFREQEKKRTGRLWLKGPMYIYFLHPLVIILVRGCARVVKMPMLVDCSPVYYLCVCAGSFCLTALLCLLQDAGKDIRKKAQNSKGKQ